MNWCGKSFKRGKLCRAGSNRRIMGLYINGFLSWISVLLDLRSARAMGLFLKIRSSPLPRSRGDSSADFMGTEFSPETGWSAGERGVTEVQLQEVCDFFLNPADLLNQLDARTA